MNKIYYQITKKYLELPLNLRKFERKHVENKQIKGQKKSERKQIIKVILYFYIVL